MRISLTSSTAVACSLAAAAVGTVGANHVSSSFEALDEAILNDILQSYTTYEPTTCNTSEQAAATSFSYDWPGNSSTQSSWATKYVPFEQGLFNAIMSHTDQQGNRSWSMRFGTGGNAYSLYFPNAHGETIAPQKNNDAPWIDEVMQSVAVPLQLNAATNLSVKDKCFVHQAGAYQRDSPYTNTPFFSPSLAKHCSGNSCAFASWGTQAQVKNVFTSAIMYINKYTNCGNGVIEHTQMIHNFANPNDALATEFNTDYTYFDVPWAGVRASNLRYALEPDTADGTLTYENMNDVDYLPLCKWGNGHDTITLNPAVGRAQMKDLNALKGYTAFVDGRLIVNHTSYNPILPACRKPVSANFDCTKNYTTCMVASCNQTQIDQENYTRIELKVAANSHTECVAEPAAQWYDSSFGPVVMLKCDMHDTDFGRQDALLTTYDPCSPWTDIGFFNSRTGRGVHVAMIKYWSWVPTPSPTSAPAITNKKVYFAVYSKDAATAVATVNSIFNNTGNSTVLPIEIRPLRRSNTFPLIEATTPMMYPLPPVPTDYNPSVFNAFTYVYGRGEDYGVALEGRSRRRIGSTDNTQGRDFTVFNINWYGTGAKLQAGSTYTNRGYYFSSSLGNVKATAESLRDRVAIDEVGLELWTPRKVAIYKRGTNFVAKAASLSGGSTTTCASSFASLECSGTSTPKAGHVAFFYVTCGSSTYFGPNPYHFTPPFGSSFPGHGSNASMAVRPYVCNGMSNTTRPNWKLMGFFNYTDTQCASLATATYNETVCDPDPSSPPTASPTTQSPMASPTTASPTTATPASSPTTASPTTVTPTSIPTTATPTTASPTTTIPTSSPPTASPTSGPTTASPTSSPTTGTPTTATPTSSPTTASPTTASPTTASPTSGPTTASPTFGPTTASPTTASPTSNPTTASPTTASPTTASPTSGPTTASPTSGPTTASPTTASPTTASPTSGPTTATPTTATPTSSPTTASPTTATPTSSPTTASPTTASPTSSPTSASPTTAGPTTKSPTSFPTTTSPTSSPTTTSPTTRNPTSKPTTASPTTRNPTSNPTTRAPTSNPTTRNPTTRAPTSNPTSRAPTSNPTTRAPTSKPPTSQPTTKKPTPPPTPKPKN